MGFDFDGQFNAAVKAQQEAIEAQAAREVLASLFSSPGITLVDLKDALVKADGKGILGDLKLGQVFTSSGRATGGRSTRLSVADKSAAVQVVLSVLGSAKKPMGKADIVKASGDSNLQAKWQTVIKTLEADGLVKDNGKARGAKAYTITENGRKRVAA